MSNGTRFYEKWAVVPWWALNTLIYGGDRTLSYTQHLLLKEWMNKVQFCGFSFECSGYVARKDDIEHQDSLDHVLIQYHSRSKKNHPTHSKGIEWKPTKYITREYPNGDVIAFHRDFPQGVADDYWQIYSHRPGHNEDMYWPGTDKWNHIMRETTPASDDEVEQMRYNLMSMPGCFDPEPIKRPGRWRS